METFGSGFVFREDFGGESDSDRVVGQGETVDPTQDAPAPA